MLFTFQTLFLRQAREIVEGIISAARADGGKQVSIAVCGAYGQPVCAAAMDLATLQSYPIAANKAYTAVALGRDTLENASRIPPLDPNNFGDSRITMFPGGVVIRIGNDIVGAVGVSGRKGKRDESDTIDQDHELAMAAVERILKSFEEDGIKIKRR